MATLSTVRARGRKHRDTFFSPVVLSSRVNSIAQNSKNFISCKIEMTVYKLTHVDVILVISEVPGTFLTEKQIAS